MFYPVDSALTDFQHVPYIHVEENGVTSIIFTVNAGFPRIRFCHSNELSKATRYSNYTFTTYKTLNRKFFLSKEEKI